MLAAVRDDASVEAACHAYLDAVLAVFKSTLRVIPRAGRRAECVRGAAHGAAFAAGTRIRLYDLRCQTPKNRI